MKSVVVFYLLGLVVNFVMLNMKKESLKTKTVALKSAAVFMLLFCFSCQNGNVYNNQQIEDVDSSEVKIISIPSLSGTEVGLFSDVYSSVNYIPLESTPNSLVGEISRLFITKSGYFLVYDKNNSSIMVFDSEGKFRNLIGHCGHGPNEYIFANEVAYNHYNDQVVVYDNVKKTILNYDINGNFLNKYQLNYHVRTFDVVDESHIAVYMDYDADFTNQNVDYNYKIIDNKGIEVKFYDPFHEDMSYFNASCRGTFHHYSGSLYCQSPYSSFISEITSDDLVPRYYLSFGKDGIPQDWKKGDIHEFNDKIKKYSNLTFCENFYESKAYYVMNLVRNKMFCNLLIKKDKNTSTAAFTWINDINGLVASTDIKSVSNDKIYYSIQNSTFQNVYKSAKDLPCNEDVSERFADNLFKDLSLFSFLVDRGVNEQIKMVKKKYNDVNLTITEKEKESLKTYASNNNPVIQVCALK